MYYGALSNVEYTLTVTHVQTGALSDVEYTITVTDTATGKVKTYKNPKGRLASFGDTAAF